MVSSWKYCEHFEALNKSQDVFSFKNFIIFQLDEACQDNDAKGSRHSRVSSSLQDSVEIKLKICICILYLFALKFIYEN
jgi:hypothetical protein